VKRPRVKHVHSPVRCADGTIYIGTFTYGVTSKIADDSLGTAWSVLALLDGTRSKDEVIGQFDGRETVAERLIDDLASQGFIEDVDGPPVGDFTEDELSRYSANTMYFSWVDDKPRISPLVCQQKLKNSRVVIVGLGGTGGAVAMSLVAAGVGSVTCVDYDTVERSNLNRQLLFKTPDIGRSKVDVAVSQLRDLNPHVTVTGVEKKIDSAGDIESVMQRADLLILCADEPRDAIQLWVDQASHRTGIPWMMCFYAGPSVLLGILDRKSVV